MNKQDKNRKISRRQMMGMAGLFLAPFASRSEDKGSKEEEYDVLLKPDGTTVKVAKSVISKAKVVDKKVNNRRLFSWLKISEKS